MFDLTRDLYLGSKEIERVYLGGEILKSSEPPVYVAQDSDFDTVGYYPVYIGSALEVDITEYVNAKGLTSIEKMFGDDATPVTRVVLGENGVSYVDFSFRNSQATSLDLSSFDTSRVTRMYSMFDGSQATSLDLSSFDTSRVKNMYAMFYGSKATTLDLSSFDTSRVTDMSYMFGGSKATIGYARTQADADRFNKSRDKPSRLKFVVHPDLV